MMIKRKICRVAGAVAASLALSAAAEIDQFQGVQLYQQNCANCHGVYGEGDGVVAPDLSVVLLDLRYLSDRNSGVFPEEFTIRIIDGRESRAAHGPDGMPVWGAEFSRNEGMTQEAQTRVAEKITALTRFLESIQKTP
jgi:hypothetical protein